MCLDLGLRWFSALFRGSSPGLRQLSGPCRG